MNNLPDLAGIRQQQLAVEQAISGLKKAIAAADRVMDRNSGDLLMYRALEQYRANLVGQLAVVLVQQELTRR